MRATTKLRRRRRRRIDLVGRLFRACARPTRQAMIVLLAKQPMDVASLAKSLGQTDAWTRYWLARFMQLNVVVGHSNGNLRRRIYRLGDGVTVERKGIWLTFRFPPLDGSRVEFTLKASSLPIDLPRGKG